MTRHSDREPATRRRISLWRLARANFYDLGLLLRDSWIVLAAFGLIALGCTIYLLFFYRGTPHPTGVAEALYETLKLLTLQSSLSFPQNDPLGEVLFFLIPLLGLALIFQSVLNFGRLLLDKGSRREAWQLALASTYRDHVIICGFGRVSLRVATQLIESGCEVVVIEGDWSSEFVSRVLHMGIPVVQGDAREHTILRQAGIQRARAVFAGVNDDLINIEIALAARAVRPDVRVTLRVFSEELDSNLERNLGRNSAFSPSALAAPTFAAAAVSREIEYVIPIAGELLAISQVTMVPEHRLGDSVHTLESTTGVRVLNGHPPNLHSGDTVTLLGPLAAIEAARQANTRASQTPYRPGEQFDSVIVCGLGKVGYRVVRQLYRMNPRPRIVVVRLGDGRNEFPQRISQLDGITTIIGDARDIDVLRAAGIDRTYAIAALTSDDLLNVQIGLAARRYRPEIQVVLRVFSDVLAERLADMFGFGTIYSTSALAGPTLAAAAMVGDIRHAFVVEDQLFSAYKVRVASGAPLADQTVAAIREQHGTLVIGIRRDGIPQALPALETMICPGDELILLAHVDALVRLRTMMVDL